MAICICAQASHGEFIRTTVVMHMVGVTKYLSNQMTDSTVSATAILSCVSCNIPGKNARVNSHFRADRTEAQKGHVINPGELGFLVIWFTHPVFLSERLYLDSPSQSFRVRVNMRKCCRTTEQECPPSGFFLLPLPRAHTAPP